MTKQEAISVLETKGAKVVDLMEAIGVVASDPSSTASEICLGYGHPQCVKEQARLALKERQKKQRQETKEVLVTVEVQIKRGDIDRYFIDGEIAKLMLNILENTLEKQNAEGEMVKLLRIVTVQCGGSCAGEIES